MREKYTPIEDATISRKAYDEQEEFAEKSKQKAMEYADPLKKALESGDFEQAENHARYIADNLNIYNGAISHMNSIKFRAEEQAIGTNYEYDRLMEDVKKATEAVHDFQKKQLGMNKNENESQN